MEDLQHLTKAFELDSLSHGRIWAGELYGQRQTVGTSGQQCMKWIGGESLSSVQSLSHIRLFATPWTAARQASLSITNSWSLLKLMSIESVMPSNHLVLCRPFLLLPALLWSMWSPRVGHNLVTEHQRSENFPTHPWACVVWTPTGALGLAAGKMGRGAEGKREWWHPRAIRGQISTWGQTLYYLSLSGKEKTEGTVKKKEGKDF